MSNEADSVLAVRDRHGDVWRGLPDSRIWLRDRDGRARRYTYLAEEDELGCGPLTPLPGACGGGAQPLLDRLSRYCTSWEVSHDEWARVWNDPDGGELRIVAALRRVLTETHHSDVHAILAQEFDRPGANDNASDADMSAW